jgi:hypothetical protein
MTGVSLMNQWHFNRFRCVVVCETRGCKRVDPDITTRSFDWWRCGKVATRCLLSDTLGRYARDAVLWASSTRHL